MDFHTVQETDMSEHIRNWNISKYSDNDKIRQDLPHSDRLQIVGNRKKGEVFLEILNISSDDVGLYKCDKYENQSGMLKVTNKTFIVQLKCKYRTNLIFHLQYNCSLPNVINTHLHT